LDQTTPELLAGALNASWRRGFANSFRDVMPWRRFKLSATEGRNAQKAANKRGRSKLPIEGPYCQGFDDGPGKEFV